MARKRAAPPNPFEQSYLDGAREALAHPIFRHMHMATSWREDAALSRARGWARVHPNGLIVVNKHARLAADEWAWVVAHCALHVGFGHVDASHAADAASAAAACTVVTRF